MGVHYNHNRDTMYGVAGRRGMETEDTGSGKEDEPEHDVTSEQEEDDTGGPSTSSGSNPQR